ncbi:hypothetical protein D3C80_2115400 [compost metagenome]
MISITRLRTINIQEFQAVIGIALIRYFSVLIEVDKIFKIDRLFKLYYMITITGISFFKRYRSILEMVAIAGDAPVGR